MATRYWVGGSGTWDATSTTNWSASTGGASGASAPTAADSVIFDANSNVGVGAFTVTVSAALCLDFSTGGAGGALDGAMTLAMGTSTLTVSGSWTNPATNFAFSGTGTITFNATTTGKTITTNGISWPSAVVFNGSGGAWTLGGAWTTTSTITVTAGTFSTSASNYNVSATALLSSNSNTRTITLNGSTVTLTLSGTALDFTTATNLTFTAGTSTVTCSGTSPTFNGGSKTFNIVTFTSTGTGTTTLTGINTFTTLTFSTIAATGFRIISIGGNQTVSGTLTLNTGTGGVRRFFVQSNTLWTQRTLTVGTLAAMTDVDFRDIIAAGASAPWSGTRIGNCANNSNITFTAGASKYWNLAAGGSWSATAWALSSGGAVAAANFPLAQDTVYIENTGLNTSATITIDANWNMGSLDFSSRSNAFNWTQGNSDPQFYGTTITLSSAMTMTTTSGSPTFNFYGNNITQTFNSAGILVRLSGFTSNNINGSLVLAGNTQIELVPGTTAGAVTITYGTFDLAGYTLTCFSFSSSNSNTRTIAFGTGNITLTGNSGTIWNTGTSTNFSYTGTPTVNATYSGATGTRTLATGGANDAININITGGTDIVLLTSTFNATNLNFSGFAGTLSNSAIRLYGNLTLSTGMTLTAGTSALTFFATSGTQLITSSGKTLDFPVTVNTTGATVQLQDNLTIGSTRTLTLTAGTLDLTGNSGNWTLSTGLFASSTTTTRSIAFGTSNITVTGNNATVWSCATLTNFSYTGTPTVNFNYSGSTGTRTIQNGSTGGTETNAVSMNVTAGSDTFALPTTGVVKNFSSVGFTGLSNLCGFHYGNLTLGSGSTQSPSSAAAGTFAATSGTQTITSNGVTIDRSIAINAPGATVQLADALLVGSARQINHYAGTFTTNGYSVTCGRFGNTGASATGNRTLNLGASSFTCVGTSDTTAGWFVEDSGTYSYTVNAGTSTIYLAETYTGSSTQNFAGAGKTYYNLVYTQGQPSTISGNNIFNSISNTFQPITVKFEAGSTQTVANFGISGTSGNLVTLNSATPGTRFNLITSNPYISVQYCDIKDSAATPADTWFSRLIDGNVDSGNNTGWVFAGTAYSLAAQDTSTVTDASTGNISMSLTVSDTATVTDSDTVRDYWVQIDDTQTANWQQVDDTQTANWSIIPTQY